MKIKIAILGLALTALALFAPSPVAAVEFRSFDLLAVPAVYVTNTFSITNTSLPSSVGTNLAGTTFTNNRTRVVASGSTGTSLNLLGKAQLYPLSTGAPAYASGGTNGIGDVFLAAPGFQNISVTWQSGSGANSAVTFVVTPVWDGVNPDTSGTADFTFAFTPTVSSTQTFATNCPSRKWIGASHILLSRIVNTNTSAAGHVIITDVKLNQWVPDASP